MSLWDFSRRFTTAARLVAVPDASMADELSNYTVGWCEWAGGWVVVAAAAAARRERRAARGAAAAGLREGAPPAQRCGAAVRQPATLTLTLFPSFWYSFCFPQEYHFMKDNQAELSAALVSNLAMAGGCLGCGARGKVQGPAAQRQQHGWPTLAVPSLPSAPGCTCAPSSAVRPPASP